MVSDAIIWASCFLPSSDPIYEGFSQLGALLRERGAELVLFGGEGDYSRYTGFHHYACPILIGEHGRSVAFWAGSAKLPMGAGAFDEFMALDRAWGAPYGAAEAELYTLKGVAFWEHAFALMQPSAILCWGATLPFSRLLLRLAQQRQRPAYVIERGPLEGTLMVSLSGQTALTSANTLPSLIAPSMDDPRLADRWDAITRFYNESRDRHYSQFNQIPDEGQSPGAKDASRPKILYLGTFDTGSGCSFADPALGDVHGTWVKSSLEGARAVAKALAHRDPDAALWIKPHPACPFTLSEDDERPAIVRDMSRLDVRHLIRESDICVTLASTTQMLAFLEDRPAVTLGNGFLMGRDIAYAVGDAEELPMQLGQALERRDWPRRLRDGRALLAALFEYDLIALEPDVPARLGLEDLAILLGRFAGYRPHPIRSVRDRIDDFQTFRFMARHDVAAAADQAERRMLDLVRERNEALREIAAWTDRCARAESAFGDVSTALATVSEEATHQRIRGEELEAALAHIQHEYSAVAENLAAEISRHLTLRANHEELTEAHADMLRGRAELQERIAVLEARQRALEQSWFHRIFRSQR